MREYQNKLESGEYVLEWGGYSPFYVGCHYGDSVVLGGEEQFSSCHDFFSGGCDVEWWKVSELEKLSDAEKVRLLEILERNKTFEELKHSIIPKLAKALNVEEYQLHRISNKELKAFLDLVDSKSNSAYFG